MPTLPLIEANRQALFACEEVDGFSICDALGEMHDPHQWLVDVYDALHMHRNDEACRQLLATLGNAVIDLSQPAQLTLEATERQQCSLISKVAHVLSSHNRLALSRKASALLRAQNEVAA